MTALKPKYLTKQWMEEFKAEHGVYPIAGGSTDADIPGETESAPMTSEPGTLVVDTPAPPKSDATTGEQFFTKEQVSEMMTSARREEKDKLYGQIDELKTSVRTIREESEAVKAQREAEEAAENARLSAMAEDEMSAKELLQKKSDEWQQQFQTLEQELASKTALIEREREFAVLQQHREARLAEHGDNILPELRDMVQGNTAEEIDATLNTLIEKTSAIISQTQQAMQTQTQAELAQRQQMQGVRPTAPSVGPIEDNEQMQQTISADQLRGMSMSDYAKNRTALLRAASAKARSQGIYGR